MLSVVGPQVHSIVDSQLKQAISFMGGHLLRDCHNHVLMATTQRLYALTQLSAIAQVRLAICRCLLFSSHRLVHPLPG